MRRAWSKNRRWPYRLGYLALVLLWGCSPLEQQGVPISFGMRLNGIVIQKQLREDIAAMRHYGTIRLQVELLVEPDSNKLPIIDRASLQQWRKIKPILKDEKLKVTLSFTPNQDSQASLWHGWSHARREYWFSQYTQELRNFLQANRDIDLERVVVANYFEHIANYNNKPQWEELIKTIRKQTQAKITYAAPERQIKHFPAWALCDEIGINYPSTEFNQEHEVHEHKKYAMEKNELFRQVAIKYNKPVYISHANLFGPRKLIKLKNRLRFFKEVEISGLCLNSVFPDLIIHHSMERFRPEKETLEYLKDYLQQ